MFTHQFISLLDMLGNSGIQSLLLCFFMQITY